MSVKKCNYIYNFTPPFEGGYPYNAVITVNAISKPSVTITSQSSQDAFFTSYGFVKINNEEYATTELTSDVFGQLGLTAVSEFCSYEYNFTGNPILGRYPFTIAITVNGVLQSAVTINSQSDLDTFFASYGFTNKIGNADYGTDTVTQTIFGDLQIIGTIIAPVNAPVLSELTFQKCTYSLGSFSFTSFTIDLGGHIQTENCSPAATTIDELVVICNGFFAGGGDDNRGFGYYFKVNSTTLGAQITSNIANFFGNLNAVVPGNKITGTNSIVYDISSFAFPSTTGARITINGTTYINSSTIADATALVAWLNTLYSQSLGIFTLTSPTQISVSHPIVDLSVNPIPFSTVSAMAVFNGVTYTMATAAANGQDLVTWLNTLGVGIFGLNNTGANLIYYIGNQNWDTITLFYSGPNSIKYIPTASSQTGALNPVTILQGYEIEDDTEGVEATQSGCSDTSETVTPIVVDCYTPPTPIPGPSNPLRKNLIVSCEKNVVSLGCQELKWAKIGKPVKDLIERRITYLNALWLLKYVTMEADVKTIDCFLNINNQ